MRSNPPNSLADAAVIEDDFTPERMSHRRRREHLLYKLREATENEIEQTEKYRTSYDPQYARLAARYEREADLIRTELAEFDRQVQAEEAAGESDESNDVRAKCLVAARQVECDAAKFAASLQKLKKLGGELAAATQTRDPGLWPSRQMIDQTIRAFVINALGDAGIPLQGYGSAGRKVTSLVEKFGGKS